MEDSEQRIEMSVFGHDVSLPAHNGTGYALFALRITIGWIFLTSGLSKLAESGLAYGYASQYLAEAVPVALPQASYSFPGILSLPLVYIGKAVGWLIQPVFQLLSSLPFIGGLVVISEILVGLLVLFGLFTRLGSYIGAFMMLMFYYGNAEWSHGLINGDFIYMLAFIVVAVVGAGRIIGLDQIVERTAYVRQHPWTKHLLG